MTANLRIHANGSVIDTLEKKLLDVLKVKEERKQRGEIVNTLSI